MKRKMGKEAEMAELILNETIINELVNGLIELFGAKLEQVILYGSFARGDADEESDIDVAVILSAALSPDIMERFIAFNAELDLKYNKVFSIIDINRDDIQKWGTIVPFYKNINREGIVLWKAA